MRLQAARLEINKLLTPEQVQKLDERFERLQKLWNPSSSGTEE
jgi:Spy/CpxP family protein refolding chaperone